MASYQQKDPPPPSLMLVTHPESDVRYVHFEVSLADGSTPPAKTALPFDVGAKREFSSANAWWLSEAALLSYWDASTAGARFRDQAGLSSEPMDREGTQCYVASNGAFTVVAFRGTQPNEKADVWSDVDFVPHAWERGGSVHEGFKHALEVVWPLLNQRLQKEPADTVWFTGHSLGGAIATLAADRFGEPAGVYTFGSPRVGKQDFVDGFDKRHRDRSFRYSNNHDVVTHVPPSAWRFAHVGAERHIDGEGVIGAKRAGSGATVIQEAAHRFSNTVTEIRSGASILPAGIIDHTPRRYATFVWNAFVASPH